MALDLIHLISKESNVPLSDFGVHGSIALNMHAPESDIDFVVYGTENFRLVEEAIARLVNTGKTKLHYWQPYWRQQENSKENTKAKSSCTMPRKSLKQVKEKYGAYRYIPLDPVRFQATVCDDTETMYRPATYKISGYKPQDDQSELDLDKIPIQVVSNIGCYRNVARAEAKSKSQANWNELNQQVQAKSSIKWLLEQQPQRKNTFGQ